MPAHDPAPDAATFDPNQVMDDFAQRLRERDKPVDLAISQATLRANAALGQGRLPPEAPSSAAARREKRWRMEDVDDVEDVDDISGRTAPGTCAAAILPAATALPAPQPRSREQLPWVEVVETVNVAADRAASTRPLPARHPAHARPPAAAQSLAQEVLRAQKRRPRG